MAAKKDEDSYALTLKEAYETGREYTIKASEITRQLGFAGLAIIWVFKTDTGGRQVVPPELFFPGLLLVIGLALDLLQYVISAEIWLRISRRREKKGVDEFTVRPWINYFGTFFYWSKIIAIGAAYYFLISFLLRQVF